MFVMIWDFRVDWGLVGSTPGFFLRDPKEMKFKPRFYIICMILNVIFRFWWVIGIWFFNILDPNHKDSPVYVNIEMAVFIGMMIEAIRRTFWAIIRIENEFFHNIEQYREIINVPPMKD